MKSENRFLLQASGRACQIPALIFENVVSSFIGFDQLCDHCCRTRYLCGFLLSILVDCHLPGVLR